ncbi:MAG: hypothetical protein A2V66_14705 [Ignavibacteria bacterium RBG_13_36_8]|nr:MAG: hypothetical protein A2V66_14705 [Ignavibacteria bacterium RBG_13_36_8]
MRKNLKIRFKIFFVFLTLLILLSLVPIFILIEQSIASLDITSRLSKETIESTVNEQTIQLYKANAQNLANRISEFLNACDLDLRDLSTIPRDAESYLKFSQNHPRKVKSTNSLLPLYKEISFVDRNGNEIIKISNNKIIPRQFLKNISNPINTTFKLETYFFNTKESPSDIFVTHLTGWYVSRSEQLEQEKTYNGLIRFCLKLTDQSGQFNGLCMIALDHIHLLDFVNFESIEKPNLVNKYKTGSYTYIFDDEGWIISHQKLWDIRGLDKDGLPVEPLTVKTPSWKYDAGVIPINLLYMDWRLRDIETNEPMSAIVMRIQRGETVLTTMKSMGIYGEAEGIIRTRAYAPIFYSTGPYNKYGIFGAVAVGTSLKQFMDKSRGLTEQIDNIDEVSRQRMLILAAFISIGVLVFSFIIAKSMAKPLRKINDSFALIAKGIFTLPEIKSSIIEIEKLSHGMNDLAVELNGKEKKLKQYVQDLELVNEKLNKAKKELALHWHHDYQMESDNILEEKIKSYENEYPKLKEIRNTLCIGNSPKFLRVIRQVIPQSQMTIPTWICGDSGVGKSAVAQAIHLLSPRHDKSFQVFPASEFAAADPLIVSGKLFGYGSGHGLMGIDKNGQDGIIKECDGGTLVIDDVDTLPLESQAQILRVVDGLSFHTAAGKSNNISADVRFLFASHQDLELLVKEGKFRKDLFRRMGANFNKIEIPSLRERISDVPILARHFVHRYCEKHKIDLKLEEDAISLLLKHDYKEGNIGELKVLIEIACEGARLEGSTLITLRHFQGINKRENTNFIPKNNEHVLFTGGEIEKLNVLRKNLFKMEISEIELGFKPGSRTLSQYLRGMCLKALLYTNWDINEAINMIANDHIEKLSENIKIKIEGYISNISEKVNTDKENSLFKNLPKEYHTHLIKAIEHYKIR